MKNISPLAAIYIKTLGLKDEVDAGMCFSDGTATKGQALAVIARAERAAAIVTREFEQIEADKKLGSMYRDAREFARDRGAKFPTYARWVEQRKPEMMKAFCEALIQRRRGA